MILWKFKKSLNLVFFCLVSRLRIFPQTTFGSRYSRMDQVKFFKGCLPQILLGPFLNTLTHFQFYLEDLNIFSPVYPNILMNNANASNIVQFCEYWNEMFDGNQNVIQFFNSSKNSKLGLIQANFDNGVPILGTSNLGAQIRVFEINNKSFIRCQIIQP